MRSLPIRCLFIIALVPLGFAASAQTEVALDPLPRGAVALIGSYAPQKLDLSRKRPASLKKAPPLKNPLYGVLPAKSDGGKRFNIAIDQPKGGPSLLYVDSNGNGDLSDDASAEWAASGYGNGYTAYSGGAFIELSAGADKLRAFFGMYLFDPADPSRASLKDVLLYYREYAYSGRATIGGETYPAVLSDESASGDFRSPGTLLLLDRDGDGKFDERWESFEADKPFALNGKNYIIKNRKALGGRFSLADSKVAVAEKKLPVALRPGAPAIAFDAVDLDGAAIHFPADYRGKIVLLDFWATWCGPCVGEIPGTVAAYAAYHGKGFEIIGVSLDKKGQETYLRSFMKDKGMGWRQVYDGGGWKARLALEYSIDSIPAPFLVDGDSGKIIALGDDLRGDGLKAAVERALASKSAKKGK
jgi:thiol-disulfide isomerase/thioredoxin